MEPTAPGGDNPRMETDARSTPGREALVAALRRRGVGYLAPSDATEDRPLGDLDLVEGLARHGEARLRQALIPLFLLHPHLASLVRGCGSRLEPPARVELQAHYMAAVYLQRMWSARLRRYLGALPELPDHFSTELGLPTPEDEWGKAGLHALADWHATASGRRANRLSEYEGTAELLFGDLKHGRREGESTRAG